MDRCDGVLLQALAAAVTGGELTLSQPMEPGDWQALAAQAQAHKVLPLVYQSLSRDPDAMAALAAYRPTVRSMVMVQTQKTHALLALLSRLEAAGIRVLVVKGLICREMYLQPDLRPSSDEDLLVAPHQYEAAQKVLADFGMTCEKIRSGDYERDFRMEKGPLFVELHQSLFCPTDEVCGPWNAYFAQTMDRAVPVTVQGVNLWTMEPTDHMLYLLLHAFKHFIHSGVGIRQVCDICLYARTPGIRWDRVEQLCEAVYARGFVRALLAIGRQYLGLDAGVDLGPGPDPEALLEDMLASGVYGTATAERLHSGNMTLGAVTARVQGKNRGHEVLNALFPAPRKLEDRYPYLKEKPWLAPAAWTDRILRYVLGGQDGAEAAALGARRVALLRQYGVIEEE